MANVIRDSSGNVLRNATGVLLMVHQERYCAHDWTIDPWVDSFAPETPIPLYPNGAGYATGGVYGWLDRIPGVFSPGPRCAYIIMIKLYLVAGELVWKGTFTAFTNRTGYNATYTAQISKTDAGYLDPVGVWQVDSLSQSGTGINVGTSIEIY